MTVLEDPPDGGPVAGLAAGLAALPADGPELVVVLACDVPGAGRVLPALLAAVSATPTAPGWSAPRATAAPGRRLPPDGPARGARRAARRVHGAAMHRLVADLRLVDVADDEDATADADTWADVERLDAALSDRIDP